MKYLYFIASVALIAGAFWLGRSGYVLKTQWVVVQQQGEYWRLFQGGYTIEECLASRDENGGGQCGYQCYLAPRGALICR